MKAKLRYKEERLNTEIMRLILNLLLLHQSEEWVNAEIQSKEKVNINLMLQLFQLEERMIRLLLQTEERVNTEIMRLLINLLQLHQSEE